MFEQSTATFTRVFGAAQREARERNQEFVGIEHLALALLDDESSEAVRVLRQMNVESGYVRNALAHTLPKASEPPLITGDLPISPKTQRLISNAVVAAQTAGANKVSSRFLLSAVLAEAGGVVCESFRRSGADPSELSKALREKNVTAEA